jgi:hypothetical protein
MGEAVDTLRFKLEQKSSDELTTILRNRDEDEWRPEAFEMVAAILKDRGFSPGEIAAMGPEGYDAVEGAPTTIGTFVNEGEAQALRMALEEAGIAAWVVDEARGQALVAEARLQVRAADAEAARQILEAAQVTSEPSEEE